MLPTPERPFWHSKAFTFLEIVAALAVLAIGILAVITLFPVGLENSRRASEHTRAALLVYQELQRYRMQGYQFVTGLASNVYGNFLAHDPYYLRWVTVKPYTGASAGTQIKEVTVTAVWPATQSNPAKRRELPMSTLISER